METEREIRVSTFFNFKETQNGKRVSKQDKQHKQHHKEEPMVTEIQEKILNAAIEEFTERGLKFTMNDVAKNLGMSKKTIYTIYESKEEMLLALADYCFQDIKKSEQAILQDESMDVLTKIEKIMVVLPEKYQNIGLSNLYQLKEKYPHVYQRTAKYLETDWDATISLLEQGMQEKKIRKISIPVLKTMLESTIQQFFASDVLIRNGISYEDALQEMIQILICGILSCAKDVRRNEEER